MLSFKDYIFENAAVKKHSHAHFFDIDDTTHHTSGDAGRKVLVRNKDTGEVEQELNSSEFNNHYSSKQLQPHQEYDYRQFRSSKVFSKSQPIRPIIAKIKAIQNNGGRVEFNTARADMDDKDEFLNHFSKFGIDIDNSHIHRTGNDKRDVPIGEKKNAVIRRYIENNPEVKHVHLYDDATSNLDEFHHLKGEYPHIKFHAHHVQPDGSTKAYHPPEGK